ncbi:hypothetical protein ABZ519_19865 [Streptomyces collinus]|uniref:hypothetical protein n=1 Tax=Streptomyces collinus TaxID=42684 RepID=UPI0033DB63E6
MPQTCRWMVDRGFEEQWLSPPDVGFGAGVHRLGREPRPLTASGRRFTFVGCDVLARENRTP